MVAIHQAPLFLCIPAGERRGLDTTRSSLSAAEWNRPSPWPPGTVLRIKILPAERQHDLIIEIIRRSAEQWLKGSQDGIGLQLRWVSENEPAEIRISFKADQPNWSCVGSRAALYDQSSATMNFSFGTWKEDKAIYTHNHIARAAAHLFGHAFGLPHATGDLNSTWNKQKLTVKFGEAIALRMIDETGCSELRRSDSIMRFDRPAMLTTTSDERKGGSSLDEESRMLLAKLYPPWLDIFLVSQEASSMPGFQRRVRSGMFTTSYSAAGTKRFDTPFTNGVVAGFRRLDMHPDANFRVSSGISGIQPGSSFQMSQGAWHDTYMTNSISNIIGFAESDRRFQAGSTDISNQNGWTGSLPDSYVTFPRPFRTTPAVVTFISGFDTTVGRWIRLKTWANNISPTGFNIYMNTWADTTVFGFKVSWLAHESDEPSVRSGRFENGIHMNNVTEDRMWCGYSSPMKKKPRYMFTALNWIDANPSQNIRLACETPEWSESGVLGRCYTWEEVSKYCQLQSVYVAVL